VRVLQVDAGREWRGGQNQVRLLSRELSRDSSVEVVLVTQRGSELARRAAAVGVTVQEIPWSIGLDPRAAWRLYLTGRVFRPDVVHVHDSHALSLTRVARWGDSPLSRATLVGHRRVDFHIRPRSNWFRADRLIAVSAAVQRVLVADGVSPRDITVIHDGIDPDEVRSRAATPYGIRRRLGLAPGAPLAVNVAALVDHKDQCTLIRAAALARAQRPDLHWAIAGDGPLRPTLEREIAAANLGDRVHLLGYVPEADALIREADVFVMSSKEEGLGSVILHALVLEKPVVATAGGGIPEVVPAEFLVPVGDASALAAKVVDSLTHPASPIPFPAQFTAKSMADATLALYRSLV
jgi:glycosyltransferase involved in cell wall biosynthesis